MRLLIEGGLVLDLLNHENQVLRADVLLENDLIEAVLIGGSSITITSDKVINAAGKLIIPGLVNSHIHSETHLQKGLYERMPLEVWLPLIIPVFGSPAIRLRMVYLSAMLGALEMLKKGVTTIMDQWIDSVPLEDGVAEVIAAYDEVGIRALVGVDFSNKPLHQEIPGLSRLLPESIGRELNEACSAGTDYLPLCKLMASRYGARSRRVRAAIGFSAVPRCTDDLLIKLGILAKETGLRLHGHMLETRTQYVSAKELYKGGMVNHIDKLGLLNDSLTLAHSIWVDADEARLMGERGVSVVHNSVSNLKLGSGIMPLRMLESAGVNISLGTDGASSNDSLNMFEVMKLTALLQTIDEIEFKSWPSSMEVLGYAISGGAKAVGLEGVIGTIKPGAKGDLAIIDLNNSTYTPLNNIPNQLVYCEDGGNVETVIIDGQVVVDRGTVQTVNERLILGEIRDFQGEYEERMDSIARTNNVLRPYLEDLYGMTMQKFNQLNKGVEGKFMNLRKDGKS